jgi:hypothetical protein
MISLEARTTIRHLHAQGKSIRQIAEHLHLSRNTVRRALRSTQPPRYQRKAVANPELAPFIPVIQQIGASSTSSGAGSSANFVPRYNQGGDSVGAGRDLGIGNLASHPVCGRHMRVIAGKRPSICFTARPRWDSNSASYRVASFPEAA